MWRRLTRSDRHEILRMVDQAEARRLATHGPFPDAWARIQWLRRCLGGCVTAYTHGPKYMAFLGRRSLAKRGGLRGGNATLRRHGRAQFRAIGQLGALARWGDRQGQWATEVIGFEDPGDAGW